MGKVGEVIKADSGGEGRGKRGSKERGDWNRFRAWMCGLLLEELQLDVWHFQPS